MLTFQSCSYRWTRAETDDGKKIWIKQYKDDKVAEMKSEQDVFKYSYCKQNYPKYAGNILSDTIHGSTFIQFDSIRVYLFSNAYIYKTIFTTGLLSGQMLYCAMDSLCRPFEDNSLTNAVNFKLIKPDLWGWTGHTIKIDRFELLNDVKSNRTQRRFKFRVFQKDSINGHYNIFFLELTNENADNNTDINTFIKGARVTFLISGGEMIMI